MKIFIKKALGQARGDGRNLRMKGKSCSERGGIIFTSPPAPLLEKGEGGQKVKVGARFYLIHI